MAQQPDQIAYIVFDHSVLTKFMPSLTLSPIKADTVMELAVKLKIPADTLDKTVAGFNKAVVDGTLTTPSG